MIEKKSSGLTLWNLPTSDPWLVMRDFNDIAKPSEKLGGQLLSQQKLNLFNTFLNTCGLLDMSFMGPPFTWTNGRSNGQIVRTHIDRAHATSDWIMLFLDIKVLNLSRSSPIHLKTNTFETRGQKPFRFESMWMNHKDFMSIVKYVWEQNHTNLHETITKFVKKEQKFGT